MKQLNTFNFILNAGLFFGVGQRTAELLGHTERVLHTPLSPDGSTLVSAGADETLRYFNKRGITQSFLHLGVSNFVWL